ncbi:MAG TPA: hypothetical protein PKC55_18000 [Dysgonomonas sp.]|uniref:hypothetical protein n=1 Tax=unclassified Dysgonomonas TaxID=2630389 RepID=UPI0025BD42DB|nr:MULTISPECIES: hypothetical protein [unclassified Dysgonomonas]HML66722.1 hypothetical protein [Dysgonomonas sp.]
MTEKDYHKKILQVISPYFDQEEINLTNLAKKANGVTPQELYKILSKENIAIDNKILMLEKDISYLEPNPIDFDWRFTDDSVSDILNLIEISKNNIGCFGVPSVFRKIVTHSDTILFDINPFLKDELPDCKNRIIVADLNFEKIIGYEFDIIIMDPPWYTNSFINWFKQAINNLKSGGTIFTTKIPSLVRPSAVKDWESIINKINLYLSTEKKEIDILYKTPLFEIESYKSIGLMNIGDWRKAEFVSFKLINKEILEFEIEPKNNWERYKFGNKTVSIKITDNNQEIKIIPPYPDGSYILKSVSNRDEYKKKINFITSRNKALIIQGTIKVNSFLKNLALTDNFNKSLVDNYTKQEIELLKEVYNLIKT